MDYKVYSLILVVGIVSGLIAMHYDNIIPYDVGDLICWIVVWIYLHLYAKSPTGTIIAEIGFWLCLRQVFIEIFLDPTDKSTTGTYFILALGIYGLVRYLFARKKIKNV